MFSSYGKKLGLSKVELFVLGAMLTVGIAFMTVNIVWLADMFGIKLATGVVRQLTDALAAGSSLGTAFATILGVTLPAWALAAAAAMGATAA